MYNLKYCLKYIFQYAFLDKVCLKEYQISLGKNDCNEIIHSLDYSDKDFTYFQKKGKFGDISVKSGYSGKGEGTSNGLEHKSGLIRCRKVIL